MKLTTKTLRKIVNKMKKKSVKKFKGKYYFFPIKKKGNYA